MTAYRKFSDIVRARHLGANDVRSPKAPNNPDGDGPSAGALGSLATFSGGKAKNDFLSEPAWLTGAGIDEERSRRSFRRTKVGLGDSKVVAPSGWFQALVRPDLGEPELDQPCEARRGRVGEKDGLLVHFCEVCGAWGAFGYKVNLRARRLGRWYCASHRP